MANTFKKVTSADIGTTEVTVYTVPADTTTVIIGFMLANTTSSMVYADIAVSGTVLGETIPIPVGSSLSALDGKMVVEAADTIKVTSSDGASIDVILSIMEITS